MYIEESTLILLILSIPALIWMFTPKANRTREERQRDEIEEWLRKNRTTL